MIIYEEKFNWDFIGAEKGPEKVTEFTPSKTQVNWNISQSDKYYELHLDRFKCKTLYRDPMKIPSYPLAVALAEEWAGQPRKLPIIGFTVWLYFGKY